MSFSTPAYRCRVHPNSSFSNRTWINVFRREGEELFRSYSYLAAVPALKKNKKNQSLSEFRGFLVVSVTTRLGFAVTCL